MPRSGWVVIVIALLLAWGPLAFSQPERPRTAPSRAEDRDGRNDRGRTAPAERVPTSGTQPVSLVMTPGREAAALKFAQLHHPELERLLGHLERSNPAEYKRAVRKLYQDSERLARTAERSPERYELELEAWKLDSRIRLLVARMSMSSGNDELDGRLKELLQERVDLRLRQLQTERERLETRLSKVAETIDEIENDPEEAALKDLQRVKRSLGIPKLQKSRQPATER